MAFINTVTSVGDAALTESIITRSITELADDKITLLGRDALRGCRNLTKVDFPNLDSIGTSALQDCTKLETVILRKHLMCSLGSNGLNGTPIANGTGYVYVPKTVIDVYKGSSSWSALVNQIRAYEDYAYMFSDIGKVWTQSNATGETYTTVAYGNDVWVAAGSNANVRYSLDGMTWAAANLARGYYSTILFANGMWVSGCSYTMYNTGLYYSTDGKTWTQSNITSGTFYGITHANGLWVVGSHDKGLYYSADGKTWTQSNITSGQYNGVAYSNGVWVACGSKGLYYSTDGKTWTQSNITSGQYKGVAYGDGVWVATGEKLSYSTDGRTWTATSYSTSGYTVTYGDGVWVVAGNTSTYYRSTNGTQWTQHSGEMGQINSGAIGYCGLWLCGARSTGLWYSSDALTWTQSNDTTSVASDFAYANGVVVAATSNGICYSLPT